MTKTFKQSAPPTRKPRSSWPRDMAPMETPRDPIDRIISRIERREIHDSQKQARLDRKRNMVIARIELMQREGRLVTTHRSPTELVGLMPKSQVENLCRKFGLCK